MDFLYTTNKEEYLQSKSTPVEETIMHRNDPMQLIDLLPSSTKPTITESAPQPHCAENNPSCHIVTEPPQKQNKTRNLASYISIIEWEEDNKSGTKTFSHIIHTALKEVPSIVRQITHQCNPFHKHLVTFYLLYKPSRQMLQPSKSTHLDMFPQVLLSPKFIQTQNIILVSCINHDIILLTCIFRNYCSMKNNWV